MHQWSRGPAACCLGLSNLVAGSQQTIRPAKLASSVVMACIERGSLRFVPLDACYIPALLRCVMWGGAAPDAVLLFSAALWAAAQVFPFS